MDGKAGEIAEFVSRWDAFGGMNATGDLAGVVTTADVSYTPNAKMSITCTSTTRALAAGREEQSVSPLLADQADRVRELRRPVGR